MKSHKNMLTLNDIYKDLDAKQSIARVREILAWVESLPISKLPYVEMGFDALHEDLIRSIQHHGDDIKDNFTKI